jgi:hypothetical protein
MADQDQDHGQLAVVSARNGGRSLVAAYRNDTWGKN